MIYGKEPVSESGRRSDKANHFEESTLEVPWNQFQRTLEGNLRALFQEL